MEKMKCPTCGINEATEPHICPYEEDINDNHEELCTCCIECADLCALEI